jgi:hypothetical protein
MKMPKIKPIIPDDLKAKTTVPEELIQEFIGTFEPIERVDILHVLVDARTGALYSECHVYADKLVPLSTTDVPLDPEEQGDYRANREIVADHVAFTAMKEDAKERRSFSNIVTEYTTDFDASHPLKIIGGQHRFAAIKQAQAHGINEPHGSVLRPYPRTAFGRATHLEHRDRSSDGPL